MNRIVNWAFSLTRANQLYKCIETEEGYYRRKRFHSPTIGLEHQHGRRFIVLGHQYGRRDVMYVKTFHIEKKKQRLLILVVVINDEWKQNRQIFHIYYYTNTFRFSFRNCIKAASNCPASFRDGFNYIKFMYIHHWNQYYFLYSGTTKKGSILSTW